MAFRSERILITGGPGFIGRLLAQRLRGDRHDLLAVGHNAAKAAEPLFFDLCNFDSITGTLTQFRPDVIVHLAGVAETQHRALDQMYSANVIVPQICSPH